ncbi:MAG TPA: DUF2568 domain-containing protein [Polyangiaceae bacterium]
MPLAAAVAWGTLAVLGDPSRNGRAPIRVRSWQRLALELLVFAGGAAALAAGSVGASAQSSLRRSSSTAR